MGLSKCDRGLCPVESRVEATLAVRLSAVTAYGATDDDARIGSVRDTLLNRHLGFRFGGLHLEVRDISAEIAEARRRLVDFLGREPQFPRRPSRLIHLWVVVDDTNEVIGNATREVGMRGSALVVAHKQLRLGPQWRRRGFGSALLTENRDWYREFGVEFIVMEAEGDGSAFAAARGFDFDLVSYTGRPGYEGLSERQLRSAAVDRLIRHLPVSEIVDGAPDRFRESAVACLERLRGSGAGSARQVERFEQRLPRSVGPGRGDLSADQFTFGTPQEIAAFDRDEPLEVLGGSSLGAAVLARTGWSGISTVGRRPSADVTGCRHV